jgi:ribulose 1,5-bisphosphate synthetase/thiazole synthase
MRKFTTLVLIAAFAAANIPAVTEAQAASKNGCAEVARQGANNKARERVLKTALFGGMSALWIGGLISQNNKNGDVRVGGMFGGGLISGKGAKIQWKRDYAASLAKCRKM